MQIPHFLERGLDLRNHYPATLNLSLAPNGYRLEKPRLTFHQVPWHPTEPPEDFSFVDCEVRPAAGSRWFRGWIYYPHPETKPEHFQSEDVLEVLVEDEIPGLSYGYAIELRADPDQVTWVESEKKSRE